MQSPPAVSCRSPPCLRETIAGTAGLWGVPQRRTRERLSHLAGWVRLGFHERLGPLARRGIFLDQRPAATHEIGQLPALEPEPAQAQLHFQRFRELIELLHGTTL